MLYFLFPCFPPVRGKKRPCHCGAEAGGFSMVAQAELQNYFFVSAISNSGKSPERSRNGSFRNVTENLQKMVRRRISAFSGSSDPPRYRGKCAKNAFTERLQFIWLKKNFRNFTERGTTCFSLKRASKNAPKTQKTAAHWAAVRFTIILYFYIIVNLFGRLNATGSCKNTGTTFRGPRGHR